MEEVFGTIVWVVAIVGAIVAIFTLVGTGRSLRQIGGGGLVRDDDGEVRAESAAVRDEEIRQMLEARNARRERRGEAPLDVDTEIEALQRPPGAVDSELREEIRERVVARNARRVRAGEDPLDVDEQVERRIRDVT